MEEEAGPGSWIEWGAAGAALPGQVVSGDRFVVAPYPNGVLAAVVDGLGHGDQAAIAADVAVTALKVHASEAADAVIRHCHEALRRTRGVVMTLASFNADDNCMTWLGVGNVEGLLLRVADANPPRESVLLRGGVVGYQLPPLRARSLPVAPGDTLILTTDGVRGGFSDKLAPADSPQQIADRILREYNRGTDDALALVVRYLRGAP